MALAIETGSGNNQMTKLEAHLLSKATPTFNAYYNGKMSYNLHGAAWKEYVTEQFPDIAGQITSENIFKTVIDLYAENLVPLPEELRGFSNCLVPLLSRGECLALITPDGEAHFPEHFEMISDGRFTVAAMFTRSLERQVDNVIFAYGDGRTRLFQKPIPEDFGKFSLETDGYRWVEDGTGAKLYRFALDDKGIGASLAALQDRVNHSIIDLTVVAEMYARPFWYLMNVQLPPNNPYLRNQPETQAMTEQHGVEGATGRIFTTSGEGPFGQLEPPTIQDMIAYHDSIIDKIPQSFGIPGHYFKPGTGTPPTGVALKVLSKRFNNRIARIREDIEPTLIELAEEMGIEKTKEVEQPERETDDDGNPTGEELPVEYEYELWNTSDDLLQESLDAHGISLSTMGYPLKYIASVVTPGVDLDDYADDTDGEEGVNPAIPGQATDMTAMGQPGTPATPGQVEAYRQNPGQKANS